MGHHDVSTWITMMPTTGQATPVQHLLSGLGPDCGQTAGHWENWLHHFFLDKIRSVFSVSLFQRRKKNNLMDLAKTLRLMFWYLASNAMETWIWLTVYGLQFLSFLIDSEAAWSVLRYNLFILLGSDSIDDWASYNFLNLAAAGIQVFPQSYSQLVSPFYICRNQA